MTIGDRELLFPLSEFYKRSGTEMPEVEIMGGDAIPEPYKRLLVHNDDMTSVLQNFHKQSIHLDLMEFFEEQNKILRKVALLREDGRPVESGAIEINLFSFPENAKSDILDSRLPLGAILKKYKVPYSSRPECFFKIQSDAFIGRALNLSESYLLYGRINHLLDSSGESLARVVEILPPSNHMHAG
jgi:hypothetical protein